MGRPRGSPSSARSGLIIVTEVDPVKAVEAHMDGYQVMPMLEAARRGEFFVTCTGDTKVITGPHFDAMNDGAILCNAGHFDVRSATCTASRP